MRDIVIPLSKMDRRQLAVTAVIAAFVVIGLMALGAAVAA